MKPFIDRVHLAIVAALLLTGSQVSPGPLAAQADLDRHFAEYEGTFLLRDFQTENTVRINPERAATRFTPCSTFKIAHALIALETGALSGPEHLLTYDAQRHPTRNPNWARDHTLASAVRASAVWYFKETALRVGEEPMQQMLDRFNYGNRDISGGLDVFWLSSSLKISPEEQLTFLEALYKGELPVRQEHIDAVREMMVLEDTGDYRISGKTGSDGKGLSWLIGFVESGPLAYGFVYNAQLPEEKAPVAQRLGLVKEILRDLGTIPLE